MQQPRRRGRPPKRTKPTVVRRIGYSSESSQGRAETLEQRLETAADVHHQRPTRRISSGSSLGVYHCSLCVLPFALARATSQSESEYGQKTDTPYDSEGFEGERVRVNGRVNKTTNSTVRINATTVTAQTRRGSMTTDSESVDLPLHRVPQRRPQRHSLPRDEKREVISPREPRTRQVPVYEVEDSEGSRQSGRSRASEPVMTTNRRDYDRRATAQKVQAVKMLRTWGLKFGGNNQEDPEEFLEKLEDCRITAGVNNHDMINALPCVLEGRVSRWFRTARKEITSWSEFKRMYRNQFVREYDREDLLDDLRKRTQGKGEKISVFLSSFKYIISRFSRPPSEEYQVDMAFRNLLPAYRKAISDRVIITLDDLERYGREWERQLDLDTKYKVPLSPDNMLVKAAAYIPTSGDKQKVAAVKEDLRATVKASPVETEKVPTVSSKKGKKGLRTKPVTSDDCGEFESVNGVMALKNGNPPTRPSPAVNQGQQQESQLNRVPTGNSRQNYSAPGGCATTANWTGQQNNVAVSAQSWPVPVRLPSTNAQSGWNLPRGQPTAVPSAPARGQMGEFAGVCYVCNAVGHRASACPEVVCYQCRQSGHTTRRCPQRQRMKKCPRCKLENCTLSTCPNCAEGFRQFLGNVKGGGQN